MALAGAFLMTGIILVVMVCFALNFWLGLLATAATCWLIAAVLAEGENRGK